MNRKRYRPPAKPPDLVWITRMDQPVNRYDWMVCTRKEVAKIISNNQITEYVNLESVEKVVDQARRDWHGSAPVVAAMTELKRNLRILLKPRELSEEENGYPHFSDGGMPMG